MSVTAIISYDGTPNDDDALALGRLFAQAGATVALAYVRHSREFDPRRHYAPTLDEREMTRAERASTGAASVDEIELEP